MLRIGVDVGGTNADAALLSGAEVLATVKSSTTADVTSGVGAAIRTVLTQARVSAASINAVMIGTTHFLNAVVEGRHFETVGVLRLCGSATRSLPPMIDWPDTLRPIVEGGAALVGGGVNYDGSEIAPLDGLAIRAACRDWRDWRARGISAIAICSVFALVDPRMENEAAEIVAEEMPGVQMTTFFIHGQAVQPAGLADADGNVLIVTEATTPKMLEKLLRAGTIAMGCTALMTTAPMSGAFVRRFGVPQTTSQAWSLGDAVLTARAVKEDPVEAVLK